MFGVLRLIWACMVIIGHIFWLSDFGRFAVFGFYILSGYLMTLVMHKSYHYNITGIQRFISNRFLRLYPAYWFTCVLTLVLILIFGPFANGKFNIIQIPETLYSSLTNLFMIFPHWMPNQITPRLSPATWAITVELFYYLLIALGISKTKQRVYWWVALSIAFIITSYSINLYWHARYFSIPSGSLPFSLGALLFFLIKDGSVKKIPNYLIAKPGWLFSSMLVISIATSWLITKQLPLPYMEGLFYLNLAINFLLVASLATGKTLIQGVSNKWDKILGDYSYPFYLLHYQACIITSLILLGEVTTFKGHFSLSAIVTFFILLTLISTVIIKCLDTPIENFRRKIKQRNINPEKSADI